MFDITAIGEMLIDFVPDGTDAAGDNRFIRKAGGAPLNLLATAAKYGCSAAFMGKVGDDMFGKFLRDTVKKCGVDDRALITDKIHNTTLAFVSLDENGDRDFSFYRRFGADIFIEKDEIDLSLIKSSTIFHFGSLSFTSEPSATAAKFAIKAAKENGCIVSYDPNYREPLWDSEKTAVAAMSENVKYADIIKVSKEEAFMMTGKNDIKDALKALNQMGPAVVLMTDGANGVNFLFDGEFGFVPSLKVKPVDTTGAGDIFFGTFLSCFIKDGGKLEALRFDAVKSYVETAVKTSGKSTLTKGAIASIPSADEI